jgi:signal peptidase II
MVILRWYACMFASIGFADRITKWWALRACLEPWKINDYISCELTFNRGVSWSLLSFTDSFCSGCVAFLVMGVTIALALYTVQRVRENQSIVGEVAILAGACSNVYDRFVYGGVIDFMVLSYKAYAWPTFNVADVAIILGVGLLLFDMYRGKDGV